MPTIVEDANPSGPRQDFRSRNYFPAAAGDLWTYDRVETGETTVQVLTRSVSQGSGSDVVITEMALGQSDATTYRRTAEGVVAVAPFAGGPAVMNQIVGNLVEYAEPFYMVGQTRTIVRQGTTGEDIDGDGIAESFRLEYRQQFVGIENVTLPNGYQFQEVARFHNVWMFTLQPSDMRFDDSTETSTEEAWWAPGIGLVRAERSAAYTNGQTIQPAYTLTLAGGTVGGNDVFAGTGTGVRIDLAHNALVYDRARDRYYATVPGSVPVNGNRIAIIDPATGGVTYSGRSIGSQPSALALSADGSALYVALNGAGDIVKVRLSDFAEQWRIRLPSDAFFGQLVTEQIAVSPTDGDVVAVSMRWSGTGHGGVALIRNGVLQPRITPSYPANNMITFGADGSALYGFNNENSEFGLRRIAVLVDGLQVSQTVVAIGNFATRTLDWSPQGLVLDRAVYRPSDLALIGRVDVEGGGCRPHNIPDRLVCAFDSTIGSTMTARLTVVDASSLVILRTVTHGHTMNGAWLSEIVPGPVGQVALRLNAIYRDSPAEALVLYSSLGLR